MTDRQIGVAMLGLVAIAAFILWMHDKVPPLMGTMPGLSVGTPQTMASTIKPQTFPVQGFPELPTADIPAVAGFPGTPGVFPIVPLGSQAAGSESAGCGCMSWCGQVV
jgi:hypothetical protein